MQPQHVANFFVGRVPLLPSGVLLRWRTAIESAPAPLRRETARAVLRDLCSDPVFCEAVYVSSSSLYGEIDEWKARPQTARGQRVERALTRYLTRAATRSTPFGLMAGLAIGSIGRSSIFHPGLSWRRHVQLDMGYAGKLVGLLENYLYHDGLPWFPNPTAYEWFDEKLRYHRPLHETTGAKQTLTEVDRTDALRLALESAATGACARDIAQPLVEEGVDSEGAASFVKKLTEAKILISALAFSPSGKDALEQIVESCSAYTHPIVAGLRKALEAVSDLNRQVVHGTPEIYNGAARFLPFIEGYEESISRFHIDMFRVDAEWTLGKNVVDELLAAAEFLRKCDVPIDGGLARFRDEFVRRYEMQEVPLLLALDDETGIGFSEGAALSNAPLLEKLNFPSLHDTKEFDAPHPGIRDKLFDAVATGKLEIDVAESDLRQTQTVSPLPDGFSAAARLHCSSVEGMDSGEFMLEFDSCWGPPGIHLLARFGNGDAELHSKLKDHIEREENHGTGLFAEILYLPAGREGNVVRRPTLRKYEIALSPTSPQLGVTSIPLSDLLVSVIDNKVRLRSKTLDSEIIPRLSSAHAYLQQHNLPAYRFLGALQTQGVHSVLKWNWDVLAGFPFLPRVKIGRCILSRAQWIVTSSEIKPFSAEPRDEIALNAWRLKRKMPDSIAIKVDDNELIVDFSNPLSVDSFVHHASSQPLTLLTEVVGVGQAGFNGGFVTEIIVPFSSVVARQPVTMPKPINVSTHERRFMPGGLWLYVKVYVPQAHIDDILSRITSHVMQEIPDEELEWFFIRYADPDSHLRLRFRAEDGATRERIMGAISHVVSADDQVDKLVIDTYLREIERYGGLLGMTISEDVFEADSRFVAAVIKVTARDIELRERVALISIDRLMEDLRLTVAARESLMEHQSEAYAVAMHADTRLEKELGDVYRARQADARSVVERLSLAGLEWLEPLLQKRSVAISNSTDKLYAAQNSGALSSTVFDLTKSYVHMHVNRLMPRHQVRYEYVLCDVLRRAYVGMRARRKGGVA